MLNFHAKRWSCWHACCYNQITFFLLQQISGNGSGWLLSRFRFCRAGLQPPLLLPHNYCRRFSLSRSRHLVVPPFPIDFSWSAGRCCPERQALPPRVPFSAGLADCRAADVLSAAAIHRLPPCRFRSPKTGCGRRRGVYCDQCHALLRRRAAMAAGRPPVVPQSGGRITVRSICEAAGRAGTPRHFPDAGLFSFRCLTP